LRSETTKKNKNCPKSSCRALQDWVGLDDIAPTKHMTGMSFMKIFKWLAFSALLVTSVSGANAQDFDKGEAAYKAGDYQTAFKEWMPLAESGDANAQNNLAALYEYGRGVIQDDAEAFKWYRLAAGQGYPSAQDSVGVKLANGKGVIQNDFEAAVWFRRAAEQGYAPAQRNLGLMYYQVRGVTKNDFEAAVWLRRAAEQGDALAQRFLGFKYRDGEGVIQSNKIAHMWHNIASANGDEHSAEWRDEIALKMTPEAIEKAQAMAQECISSGYKSCGE
jgi:TPR repeat protein